MPRLLPAVLLAILVPAAAPADEPRADVLYVDTQARQGGGYMFAVSVKSPDRNCEAYADWWEVVSEDGDLLFRRVFMHTHPDEQPFTRPAGPVQITSNTTVVVRAHFHPTGYGGAVMRGSVANGFETWKPPPGFGAELAKKEPLPKECWR